MVDIYEKSGANPDIDDDPIASLLGYWDGTYFKPVGSDLSQVGGAEQTSGDIIGTLQSQGPISSPPNLDSSVIAGVVTGGSYVSCATFGEVWSIAGAAAAPVIELVYAVPAGSKANSVIIWAGYDSNGQGGSRYADVFAWDYETLAYQRISSPVNRISGQTNNNLTEQDSWVFGFGTICTWGSNIYTINFLPSIEYIHNNYNRGLTLSLFGLGVFIGKVNSTLINKENGNVEE
jgi:hypothetical protein